MPSKKIKIFFKIPLTDKINWLLVLAIFFLLYAPNLLREGMFVDGIWYATISNNLANGYGSLWSPMFTQTIFPEFYEHPPMVFWLQSLFFKFLGNSFWIERLYCLVALIITGLLITKIWEKINIDNEAYQKAAYLPIILWMLNLQTFFAYPNNVLECTLTIFTLSAIYLLIKSLKTNNKESYFLIFISGFLVFLAFLCKGAVALFPFVFFVLHLIVFKGNLKESIIKTLILVTSFMLCFFITLQFENSRNFFVAYIDNQIVKSILGFRTENMRESRFYILISIFRSIPISLGLSILFLVLAFFKNKKKWVFSKQKNKLSVFYFLIALSASLPIMVSLKQAGYYLTPSLPLFSIAMALLIVKSFIVIKTVLLKHKKYHQNFSLFIIVLMIISIVLAFKNVGTIDKRDSEKLCFVKQITKKIPDNSVVNFKSTKFEHSIHGFFQRHHFISLDTNSTITKKYFIVEKAIDSLAYDAYYLEDDFNDKTYNLYIKN